MKEQTLILKKSHLDAMLNNSYNKAIDDSLEIIYNWFSRESCLMPDEILIKLNRLKKDKGDNSFNI